jgi:predicted nucleic-acid-binding protein
MIAVDTNIVVRYLIKDDYDQAVLATRFLSENRCLVLKSVLLEVVWVLTSPAGYNLPRNIVHERLLHVLGLPGMETEDAVNVAQALTWYAYGMEFADALHLSSSSELSGLTTFDRKFAVCAKKLEAFPPVILVD